jgi:hypothetical protein
VAAQVTTAKHVAGSFSGTCTPRARSGDIRGIWLLTIRALDIPVLIGVLGMTPIEYLTRIGLRISKIPAVIIPASLIADKAIEQRGRKRS